MEKHVIQRFRTPPGCGYEDLKVFLDLLLAYVFGKGAGPQAALDREVLFFSLWCDYPVSHLPQIS